MGLVDLEVGERTLSLSSPVSVRGDLNLAKGVGLASGLLSHGEGCAELSKHRNCETAGSLVAQGSSSEGAAGGEGAAPLDGCRSEHGE